MSVTLLSLTSTNQSPKIRPNQIRPGSSIGISKKKEKTEKTEKKGVNHPEAYKSIPFNKTYCQFPYDNDKYFKNTCQRNVNKSSQIQKINNDYMKNQKEKYLSMLDQARNQGVEVKNMYNHIRKTSKLGNNPICLHTQVIL